MADLVFVGLGEVYYLFFQTWSSKPGQESPAASWDMRDGLQWALANRGGANNANAVCALDHKRTIETWLALVELLDQHTLHANHPATSVKQQCRVQRASRTCWPARSIVEVRLLESAILGQGINASLTYQGSCRIFCAVHSALPT